MTSQPGAARWRRRVPLARLRRHASGSLVGILLAAPGARAQKHVEFKRVDASQLRIPLPGIAVIRDSAHWATLWQRWDQRPPPGYGAGWHDTIPAIDFRREMAIAVDFGSTSGCDNRQNNIGRIVEWKDSIVVVPPAGLFGPRFTCMMIVEPVDIVRVPRSDKRVVLHLERRLKPLPAAPWWWQPSAPEFEAADSTRRAAFVDALTRDTATAPATIEAIARFTATHEWGYEFLLLERREVRSSIPALMALMRARGDMRDSALAILIRDFGATMAQDPAAPRDFLIQLIRRLGDGSAQMHDRAVDLLQNPTVASDSGLMATMIAALPDSAQLREACRRYLARWTAWQRITAPDHSLIGWTGVVSCPNMTPPPSR